MLPPFPFAIGRSVSTGRASGGPVDADGAYDTRAVYEAGMARGAEVVVPPRENAVPWEAEHPRTRALAGIAERGLPGWEAAAGYHRRSLAENAIYRFKQIFGDRLAPGSSRPRSRRSMRGSPP